MKFKGIGDNSTIREIGSIFRLRNSSDWHINIKLTPNQKKMHFGISQIPVLARRRVLNSTEDVRPAGFLSNITIENTRAWKAELIKSCPIPVVSKADDANQWCFLFEHNGIRYYLPQLELARVLFFHHAYIARLSLNHNGLTEDFDVQQFDKLGKALVNILPTSTLPLYARADHALRRVLAWILLDGDARRSYESIARYQLQDGYDTEKYRLWCFQFDPPLLESTDLTFRGHYDQNSKVFFIYEVYGVSGLSCNCSTHVEFYDPRYLERQSGPGCAIQATSASSSDVMINDEQESGSDTSDKRIDASKVAFEFANPIYTTRKGKGKGKSAGGREEGTSNSFSDQGLEVSTDEASVQGTLPSADYDGLEDQSDDAHLYADKFEAFEEMIAQLVTMSNCNHRRREIRKLPGIEGYSKHLLVDGNPRCLAFHLINKGDAVYALLEVDTSDNKSSLSTLLLKQPRSPIDWDQHLSELEIRLLKRSLVWPTSFLRQTFGNAYERIPHQRKPSENMASLDRESIRRWAERVYLILRT